MNDKLERTVVIGGEDDTFEALLKQAAHVSGPELIGLGLRLRAGDTLRDGRLRIERRIGEGGMGVVYEAFDAERGSTVALKTLSRLDAESVYRLKSEFRSLADVSHPNLCRLYELFTGGGDWFFTMELVRGVPFDSWVREQGELDENRLRHSLVELLDGVNAIHAAGKLHRDLKPSNVLVTPEGRVVVLDFGLVSDPDGGTGHTLGDGLIAGTPAYMAPEQAVGKSATTASDLYAIGAMMFEALTGALPFKGNVAQLLSVKQQEDAPSARTLAPEAPEDLGIITDALLSRTPSERPSAAHIRDTLAPAPLPRQSTPPAVLSLVGRTSELDVLFDAYGSARDGKPVVVLMSGESGMGKSALAHAFLDEIHRAGEGVVLSGRCYERENVPFKGFDALVDDLSRYLRRLPREEAAALLPRDAFALARVFPVLERVQVIADAPAKIVEDPQELRRRSFAAFGELIARIRDRRPLCIFVDDLQWIDADSVMFMRALLVDRDPAPVMLVLSYRSEGALQNERLSQVIEVADVNVALDVRRLSVEPLQDSAARVLALETLPRDSAGRDALASSIAREAGGSPFFVAELARYAARTGDDVSGLSLSNVLGTHLSELDVQARDLLEVSALAGQPLPLHVLLSASASNHDGLDELRARHLVRLDTTERGKVLACYHDRIREHVADGLSTDARSQHYRLLGSALLADGKADPALLTTCFEGSGQNLLASKYAVEAAARADQGMAFERAAVFYRKALALGAHDAPERQQHAVALADALSSAGRAREASNAYLDAASRSTGVSYVRLRQRAADELVAAGYAAEGTDLIREVCTEVGISMPRNHGFALAQFGMSQLRIRLLKLDRLGENPKSRSDMDMLRLEVMQSASRLTAVDPVYGAWASDQYLLYAHASGDQAHIARALALQGYVVTVFTPKAEERIARIHELALRYAQFTGRKDLEGTVCMWHGSGVIFGRTMTVDASRHQLLRARELLGSSRGVRYEVDSTNLYLLMVISPRLREEARHTAGLVEEAFSLGRIWSGAITAAFSTLPRLVCGDEPGVLRDMEFARTMWEPQKTAEMQWIDLCLIYGAVTIANFNNDPAATLAAIGEKWAWYERSPVSKGAISQALMHGFRGTAALALARRTPARAKELLAQARADQKELNKVSLTVYAYLALALRTGLALAEGDLGAAAHALRNYIDEPPSSPLLGTLDQLVARRRLGGLIGGADGAAMAADAEEQMRAIGVLDIERTTEFVLPGCAPSY